jgi:hypothetical protein
MGSKFSLHIPDEISVNTLLLLSPRDIHSVACMNRHFRRLVSASLMLSYHVLLCESGYEDSFSSKEPLSHRVSVLKRDMIHWSDCNFVEAAATYHHVNVPKELPHPLRTSLKQGLYLLYRECRNIQEPTESDVLHIFQIDRQCIDCGEQRGVKFSHARSIRSIPMRRGFCFDRDRHDLLATVTLETNM